MGMNSVAATFRVVPLGTNSCELGLSDEDWGAFWFWGVRVEEGICLVGNMVGVYGVVLGRNSTELGFSCDCDADVNGEKGCAAGLSLVGMSAGVVSSWVWGVDSFVPSLRAALISLAKREVPADTVSLVEPGFSSLPSGCCDGVFPFVAVEASLCCCCCEVRDDCPVLWGGVTSAN